MRNRPTYISLLGVSFTVCVLLLCITTTPAQSGRRAKTTPAPVPTPEPTLPAKPAEKPKPRLTFIVGMDRYGSFASLHLSTYSGVVRNCAQRLDEPESVRVDASEREMTRGEAVNRAKAEKEAYVVWMRIRPDTMGDDNGTSGDFNQIYIEYTVFAPTTAKQVTTGNTYPYAYRKSTVILRPQSPADGDRLFNQAARDVADKILAHFHVGMINTGP
jgi:hypothetical protein